MGGDTADKGILGLILAVMVQAPGDFLSEGQNGSPAIDEAQSECCADGVCPVTWKPHPSLSA